MSHLIKLYQQICDNFNMSQKNQKSLRIVGYKLEYDAKSRGRSVHIEFYRKVIPQNSKKLYYINGGMKI